MKIVRTNQATPHGAPAPRDRLPPAKNQHVVGAPRTGRRRRGGETQQTAVSPPVVGMYDIVRVFRKGTGTRLEVGTIGTVVEAYGKPPKVVEIETVDPFEVMEVAVADIQIIQSYQDLKNSHRD